MSSFQCLCVFSEFLPVFESIFVYRQVSKTNSSFYLSIAPVYLNDLNIHLSICTNQFVQVDKIGAVPGIHQLRDVGGEGVQQGMLKVDKEFEKLPTYVLCTDD